jgi:hypothetical protein
MAVRGMTFIVCDECGVQVGVPTQDPYDVPGNPLDAPGVMVTRPIAMRWWVQRWGWRVDADGRDLCPDHPAVLESN